MVLQPLTKDVTITSKPEGATVVIGNQEFGQTPVTIPNLPFPVDLETDAFVGQKVTLTKPGYPPVESTVSWDDGKTDYAIDLTARNKEVRIATDPPGAVVTVDGRELERDAGGVSFGRLSFPPVNEQGELKTYTARVTKKIEDTEWEPKDLSIAWDDGRSDYSVALKEIKTTPVPLTAAVFERGDEGWEIVPKHSTTLAMKDVSEGPKRPQAVRLTQLWPGTIVDTLAVSPDGSQLVFSVLYGKEKRDFRSQLMSIRTDGAGGAQYITDGKTIDLTPNFTPGGDRIIYSSNRAGQRLAVCEVSVTGKAGIRQLTTGTTNDIWPNIDSDPQPRLYYQAMVDTRPDPRLYMSQLGTTFTTDLTHAGGTQPRVSPKADQVLFTAVHEKTGKRDIYLLTPDRAENPLNLTNTPDTDEFDPSWSRDGGRVLFASDRGIDEEKRHNYDVWMLDLRSPERPTQITTNGSHDDCPVWDPTGATVYFRSNRGGEWAIWKINVE
jgi:dipeptidyl aminopeptidase/acylaminoacyl peptidase